MKSRKKRYTENETWLFKALNKNINEIPHGSYNETGDIKHFFVPSNLTYDVSIFGTGIGNFSFEHMQVYSDNEAYIIRFDNINITEKSICHFVTNHDFISYDLLIDIDGDGDIDNTIQSSIDAMIEINRPPQTPKIQGNKYGKSGISYEYEIYSHDPNNDNISYYINWGDGTYEDWSQFQESGEIIKISHVWNQRNTYNISVQAKDTSGSYSDWATLEVSMPKNKAINPFLLFLERIIERFPTLERILQPVYDRLA